MTESTGNTSTQYEYVPVRKIQFYDANTKTVGTFEGGTGKANIQKVTEFPDTLPASSILFTVEDATDGS